jgi:hypothetical protein
MMPDGLDQERPRKRLLGGDSDHLAKNKMDRCGNGIWLLSASHVDNGTVWYLLFFSAVRGVHRGRRRLEHSVGRKLTGVSAVAKMQAMQDLLTCPAENGDDLPSAFAVDLHIPQMQRNR